MSKLAIAPAGVSNLKVERPYEGGNLLLGTSAFTAAGWSGAFYPPGIKRKDQLSYYATQFRTVEIDSTYYGTPSDSTVTSWHEKTPDDFIFAVKVPQIITHEKALVGCEAEFDEFVTRMCLLNVKLGPLLFQFPHYNQYQFNGPDKFFQRLRLFLRRTTEKYTLKLAVEIRNKLWLTSPLTELLGEYKVALAMTDHSYVPRPWEHKQNLNWLTSDFCYVRFLGDRKEIESLTTVWDKTIVNKDQEISDWVKFLVPIVRRGQKVYVYINNHFQGFGPGTAKLFWNAWQVK
jgi:uncharacterized protein YecE (DUF72 family)